MAHLSPAKPKVRRRSGAGQDIVIDRSARPHWENPSHAAIPSEALANR